ncbi:WecB/TagA/CpsF family glycosyltransferase [Actinomycetospora sp. NBRC 106378]|uniref:WecB/TagA/CpsF family glycosyltransferase n=1 Tax=Actinomycetospora sp. NBRC 106378 TaxID=3032208 RepID=UPI0024A3219A|nr:WecB/TagA/CpsF family glycosyltransferase [Actinomycetospora sp. NBRC 106378]GLZ51669.1 teichoic acid biosynthesis glycosyltransferase [Actinomycetospora sp. NBRC 106378]
MQVFSTPEVAARRLVAARRPDRAVAAFTCNVDHVMLTRADRSFREAYGRADVVTMDGAPVALLSRWTGTPGAVRVTGVDIVAALGSVAAEQRLRMAIVGGAPGRADRAGRALADANPGLPRVLALSPSAGFPLGGPEDEALVRALADLALDVVVVCFGAPKQELWIDLHRDELPGAVLIGAGATVDYLSGAITRAPAVFQRTGTEAFWRLGTEFPRLWRRYLLRDSPFLVLFAVTLARHHARTAPAVPTPRPAADDVPEAAS